MNLHNSDPVFVYIQHCMPIKLGSPLIVQWIESGCVSALGHTKINPLM